jgi:phospholipase/carboxylesterase
MVRFKSSDSIALAFRNAPERGSASRRTLFCERADTIHFHSSLERCCGSQSRAPTGPAIVAIYDFRFRMYPFAVGPIVNRKSPIVINRMLHHEFIPAADKNSHHLWIMLHGLGDSIEGYRWLPEVARMPWMNFLLVNAPTAYYTGFSWFDFGGDILPGVKSSREALFELLDAQRAKGFPTEETTLGGFSQGCLISIEVGLRYPHRFAGIVGISGYVSEPETLVKELSPVAKQQRLLVTHGTQDPLIRVEIVRRQLRVLQDAGINLEYREFVKAHTIAGEEEIELIRKFVRAGYADVVGR